MNITKRSYQELTQAAEEQIRNNLADPAPQHRDWAYGVYLFWLKLTCGKPEWSRADDDRLQDLVTSKDANRS